MSKREELVERLLGDGVPADEAAALSQAAEAEAARARAPKENPLRYADPHAQGLSDLWFSQKKTATVDQKDQVGMVYIAIALGLGDEVAERFMQQDPEAQEQVGLEPEKSDQLRSFWERICEIFPGVYSREDITFLVEKWGVWAIQAFLSQLEVLGAEESHVLRALAVNAHAFK